MRGAEARGAGEGGREWEMRRGSREGAAAQKSVRAARGREAAHGERAGSGAALRGAEARGAGREAAGGRCGTGREKGRRRRRACYRTGMD